MEKLPKDSKQEQWTPEHKMQMWKECVAAFLAVCVVGCTVIVIILSVFLPGDTTRISNVKDGLLLLNSLTGVVLGYYFGSIPADARASQAQRVATQATISSQNTGNTAYALSSKGEQIHAALDRLPEEVKKELPDHFSKWVEEFDEECRKLGKQATITI